LLVERVRKEYDSLGEPLIVLRDVSLTLSPGETLAVTGPSGAGKSTLLNIIGSLDKPTSGRVMLGEDDIAALSGARLAGFRRQCVGFVFQDHHLLPQCTALENVFLPTLASASGDGRPGKRREEDAARAEALLLRVGLGDRMHAFPSELSGGERQRVAIARAMVNRPPLLLCDEPTGNLDHETAERVASLFVSLAAEENVMLLVVTHNLEFARRFSRCLELRGGFLRERNWVHPPATEPAG
jgi:lipoprotein-releasing system ATP-binding protein